MLIRGKCPRSGDDKRGFSRSLYVLMQHWEKVVAKADCECPLYMYENPIGMKELGLHILSKRIILRLVKNKEVQQNGTDYQRHHDR